VKTINTTTTGISFKIFYPGSSDAPNFTINSRLWLPFDLMIRPSKAQLLMTSRSFEGKGLIGAGQRA
jgi:hypothetical protein